MTKQIEFHVVVYFILSSYIAVSLHYFYYFSSHSGTKAGGVGQAYPQQSQQGQQLYMAYDATIQANYLPNTGVLQRGPAGPVQNSVVPTMQPSTSFYSGSTGIGKAYNSWRF